MDGGSDTPLTVDDRVLPVSETVTAVYDRILAEILSGERPAGSMIRDVDIAQTLGVSRTPVREAILLLRSTGVLEVVASRYTRVAVIDEASMLDLFRVWVTLFRLVVDELVASDIEVDLARLEAEDAAARRCGGDPHAFVIASGRFFDLVVSRSRNPHLVRAVHSVVHAIRLGLVSTPSAVELDAVLRVQAQLLDAVRARDVALGRASVEALTEMGEATT